MTYGYDEDGPDPPLPHPSHTPGYATEDDRVLRCTMCGLGEYESGIEDPCTGTESVSPVTKAMPDADLLEAVGDAVSLSDEHPQP
jgi:hypothetical protein